MAVALANFIYPLARTAVAYHRNCEQNVREIPSLSVIDAQFASVLPPFRFESNAFFRRQIEFYRETRYRALLASRSLRIFDRTNLLRR